MWGKKLLSFIGVRANKGFELDEVLNVDQQFIVLVGKNGSGKTRFLQSMANGDITVVNDDVPMPTDSIKLIGHNALLPQFDSRYDENSRIEKIRTLKEIFVERRADLDFPLNSNDLSRHMAWGGTGPLTWAEAHRIFGEIAGRLEKKSSELTLGEIGSLYDEHKGVIFGGNAVGAMFNTYMKRREDNLYNMWLSEVKGRSEVYYVLDKDFEERFGSPPWLELNRFLIDVLGGKFKFSEPGAEYDPSFRPTLLLSETNMPVATSDLSAGEGTLLWLVFTIFNTHYSIVSSAKVPSLLLIDEPDAFLHPSMVVKMIECIEALIAAFKMNIIITTHSPTTVALAPSDSIFIVDANKVLSVDQDEAISTLLDGVTQISINPHNRRQVYVESSNDVDIYESIYAGLLHNTELLDKKISLFFVSAGMKYPRGLVAEKLKEFFGELPKEKIELYTNSINGVGGCTAVRGAVQYLREAGSNTVRGLIDRDLNNRSDGCINVLGEGICYAIENLVFDPICTLLRAHFIDDKRFTMKAICGEDVPYEKWLNDDDLLQESVDRYILAVMNKVNKKDFVLEYVGGKKVLTDLEYMGHHGHSLWKDRIAKKYDALARLGGEEGIKKDIVRVSMILQTRGRFIPLLFVNAFRELQKRIN